ncbi:MAG: phage shock protein operon transcriptional activator [Chitinivibrionales bacterium]|nr:phage shock protein operon transcriptional activator [Chitinivibrionales bacterium]
MSTPDPTRSAHPFTEAIGQSEPFLAAQERLSAVARLNRPVLLLGERGTGKELAAQRLHYLSHRWQAPLVTLNCAALAPTLVETELFGHEPGAFTGAVGKRKGRFELADGGTLFLDEIGAMPMTVQEKVLRVIEYATFERVGGTAGLRVDVRIVAATNADLQSMAARGEFKQDLLDRLSFEVVALPPLRHRTEDIPLLATHFATRMAAEMGMDTAPRFSPEVHAALGEHQWPGNVRELKNVIERAVYKCSGDLVDSVDFDPFDSPWTPQQQPVAADKQTAPSATPLPLPSLPCRLYDILEDIEERMVTAALQRARYNQRRAAKLLGLTYHQFRGMYRKLHKDD